jgi:DNA-directed RNA polymerase beta' subunit
LAGILAVLEDEKLHFNWLSPTGTGIKLARPVPHPWLPAHILEEIEHTAVEDIELQYPELASHISSIVEANDRLARMLAANTPEKLTSDTAAQLENRIRSLFDSLLTPVHLRLGERELFSGRTVLVPAMDLTLEQLGMPEEMAWSLFTPFVVRKLGGDADAVEARNESAADTLDAIMSKSWVILNRAPTFEPTAILAFHPVRVSGDALHLHPLVCKWLNADFDGDQSAIFLPITEEAQREAGEKLSVAAHLSRDPGLLASLMPNLDMLWGLAYLSMQPEGLAEINRIIGETVAAPAGFATKSTLTNAVARIFARYEVAVVLNILDQLMRLGFASAKQSGASASPFMGENLQLPPLPHSDDSELWSMHREMVIEAVSTSSEIDAPEFGPQLLMQKADERVFAYLPRLISGFGPVNDAANNEVIVRNSYVEGLTPEEMYASVAGARHGIKSLQNEWARMGATFRERNVSRSFNVIPRALRAKHPGLVFARAAEQGEVDPLTDVESRLLVGLPIP